MGTLFALLVGMLIAGAGTAFGIMAHDRSRERQHVMEQLRAHGQGRAVRSSWSPRAGT